MEDSYTLFRLFKNTIKMIKIRGYDTSKVNSVVNGDFNNFISKYSDVESNSKKNSVQKLLLGPTINKKNMRNHISLIFKKEDGTKILVFFAVSEGKNSLPSEEVSVFSKILTDSETLNAIIISTVKLTAQSSNKLLELTGNKNYSIQFFLDEDMLYNPTEFILGSRISNDDGINYGIEILNDDEEEDFLDENKILKSQMPKIASGGPVAKYYGLKPGQIIKCIRMSVIPNTLINEEIFYRLVINKNLNKLKKKN